MDEATFDAFYSNSFARLVGQIHAMCGDLAEAQDCVQEAFIRAWDHRRRLMRDQSPEAWVRTTAYRLAVSRWRRSRLDDRANDRSLAATDVLGPDPTKVAVHRALLTLPADQRRALVLYHLCDLTVAEIADLFDTLVPAAKAMATLR